MAGKIGGVIAIAALVGGLFVLAAPGEAAESDCGPITLDMLFPGLDVNGNPLPTTTVPPEDDASSTSTTVPGQETTTTAHTSSTTTTAPTTTTTAESTTTTAPSGPGPVCDTWVYEMGWPLGIESRVFSGFGADRDGGARRHKGNDIVGPKLAPVVAVADATVTAIHSTPPDDCCWILLTHADGWQSLYVHLNNDNYLTDDGFGHGVRPGLEVGSQVRAGDVIGWIGDSGNAESTVPHLHFELRHPDGYSVDPHSSLQAAKAGLDLPDTDSPYIDLDEKPFGRPASILLTAGIFWPCDDRGLEFCPDRLAGPEDTASLVSQMIGGVEVPLVEERRQLIKLQESVPESQLQAVLGCDEIEDCLLAGITAGDVARLAYWANLTVRSEAGTAIVPDVRLTTAREAEIGLRAMGRIGVCHDPIDDGDLVSRAEAARLLMWWILGEGQTPCLASGEPTS